MCEERDVISAEYARALAYRGFPRLSPLPIFLDEGTFKPPLSFLLSRERSISVLRSTRNGGSIDVLKMTVQGNLVFVAMQKC